MKLRAFHKILGLVFFVFIVNAAFTGAMRANAVHLYWKNRPSSEAVKALQVPAAGLDEVFRAAADSFPAGTQVREVRLKNLLGETVFQVDGSAGGESVHILLNAGGKKISPVSEKTALAVAQAYVPDDTPIRSVEALEAYTPRKAKSARPAFRIFFDDDQETEIFVDRETAEVLTVMDRGRRFGMWMVHLHELDFFNLRRPAATILGLGTIILALSGFFLALPRRRRS